MVAKTIKFFDGKTYSEQILNEEELSAMQTEAKEHTYRERTRPRTVEESLIALNRSVLIDKVSASEDKTLAIACMALFEPWTPGAYEIGDVRTDPKTGYPKECMIVHDSRVNADWTISVASVWRPYHSRTAENALPWEAPTGAHDIYKAGEYMVWTDYGIYKCLTDTNFNPVDYPSAWEKEVE